MKNATLIIALFAIVSIAPALSMKRTASENLHSNKSKDAIALMWDNLSPNNMSNHVNNFEQEEQSAFYTSTATADDKKELIDDMAEWMAAGCIETAKESYNAIITVENSPIVIPQPTILLKATMPQVINLQKKFPCRYPDCSRSFDKKGGLASHMRVHNSKKIYTCTVCKKSFSQKCDLTKHCRKVHPNPPNLSLPDQIQPKRQAKKTY